MVLPLPSLWFWVFAVEIHYSGKVTKIAINLYDPKFLTDA